MFGGGRLQSAWIASSHSPSVWYHLPKKERKNPLLFVVHRLKHKHSNKSQIKVLQRRRIFASRCISGNKKLHKHNVSNDYFIWKTNEGRRPNRNSLAPKYSTRKSCSLRDHNSMREAMLSHSLHSTRTRWCSSVACVHAYVSACACIWEPN